MKKTLFLLLAALMLGLSASAQYYYYRPWDGNKAYSLNVGANFNIPPDSSDASMHMPLAVSIRYDGEKDINEHFAWGFQGEVTYLKSGATAETPLAGGQTLVAIRDGWSIRFDGRLTLGYYFNENIELVGGLGFFYDILAGNTTKTYKINTSTREVIDGTEETSGNPLDLFSKNLGVGVYLGCNYFFNENLFATLSVRDQTGFDFFKSFDDGETKMNNTAFVMLGIGYKFIQ